MLAQSQGSVQLKENIFYSTGCLKGSLESRLKQWSALNKKNIEISFPFYQADLVDYLLLQKQTKNIRILIHNYISFDENEFVLNLGSLNDEIYFKSLECSKNAIKLTSALGEHIYSVHSPFLFDPDISKLGFTFIKERLFSKKDVLDRFSRSIYELSRFAMEFDVQLVFENNVTTKANYNAFVNNPFIFSSLEDLDDVLPIFDDHNVGILLDLGHLRVSAETFQFDRQDFIKQCGQRVKALHLSTNNSYSDQNLMPKFLEPYEEDLLQRVIFASFEVTMASYQKNGEVCLST